MSGSFGKFRRRNARAASIDATSSGYRSIAFNVLSTPRNNIAAIPMFVKHLLISADIDATMTVSRYKRTSNTARLRPSRSPELLWFVEILRDALVAIEIPIGNSRGPADDLPVRCKRTFKRRLFTLAREHQSLGIIGA